MSSNSPRRPSAAVLTPIIVAILGITGTVIAALIQAGPEKAQLSAERTARAEQTASSFASALAPATDVPATVTPLPAGTDLLPTPQVPDPLPAVPLAEVFPQIDGGERFIFTNNNGMLDGDMVTSPECVRSGMYGLRLTWAMKASGIGSWGISWAPAPDEHFDASSYKYISIWLRGAAGGETFQLGMRDTNGGETILESAALLLVPSFWTELRVPLSAFPDVNLSMVENFHFGFTRDHSAGSICIDDISFTP